MRYSIVGGLGFLVNLSIFALASVVLKLDTNASSFTAFCVAVSTNYFLNRMWTFYLELGERIQFWSGLLKYAIANSAGLIVNLTVLNIGVSLLGIGKRLECQVVGVMIGMISNFILARSFVFKEQLVQKSHSKMLD
jgi:putative flippase GtrA